MIITFKSADELLNCKYIAMTVVGNKLRCFTCETTVSEISGNNYMLCEITPDGRGSYFTVNDKDSFLNGIDKVLSTK